MDKTYKYNNLLRLTNTFLAISQQKSLNMPLCYTIYIMLT